MSDTKIWFTVFGLTLVSILTRSLFLLFGNRITLSAELQRALRYAPIGALVAIIVPEMVVVRGSDGLFALSFSTPQWWGGVVATVVMIFSRSMLVTLLTGMMAYSLVRIIASS